MGRELGCLELIPLGINLLLGYVTTFRMRRPGYTGDGPAGVYIRRGLRYAAELLPEVEPFIKALERRLSSHAAVGPHAAYTCSEETLQKAKEIADRHNAMIHIHLSETAREVDGFVRLQREKPGGIS